MAKKKIKSKRSTGVKSMAKSRKSKTNPCGRPFGGSKVNVRSNPKVGSVSVGKPRFQGSATRAEHSKMHPKPSSPSAGARTGGTVRSGPMSVSRSLAAKSLMSRAVRAGRPFGPSSAKSSVKSPSAGKTAIMKPRQTPGKVGVAKPIQTKGGMQPKGGIKPNGGIQPRNLPSSPSRKGGAGLPSIGNLTRSASPAIRAIPRRPFGGSAGKNISSSKTISPMAKIGTSAAKGVKSAVGKVGVGIKTGSGGIGKIGAKSTVSAKGIKSSVAKFSKGGISAALGKGSSIKKMSKGGVGTTKMLVTGASKVYTDKSGSTHIVPKETTNASGVRSGSVTVSYK